MKLHIKNMVCNRCRLAVAEALAKSNLHPLSIHLGEVSLAEPPDAATLQHLEAALQVLGFEIIDDRKSRIIEKIKNTVIALVHGGGEWPAQNLSEILTQELHYEYSYLSKLFSEVEGSTIEQFVIAQKIERVKELLTYDELTLTQIADLLGYSSVAYLSNQFKKQTGLSPTFFKNLGAHKRRNLDEV